MRIFKCAMFSVVLLVLSGCAQNDQHSFSDTTNEKILQSSRSYNQLIELYKKQLAKKESSVIRKKLISTYEKVGDYSSAIFYLKPLLKHHGDEFEVQRLAGIAYLNTQDYQQAKIYLSRAHQSQPSNAAVMNLLGVLAGYQGDLVPAQLWFSKARSSMGNDQTIKNNLALIAILQQDYRTARRLLESLLDDDQTNNQQTIKANLAVVYARQGDLPAFYQLTKALDRPKQNRLYAQLRALKLVNLQQLSVNQHEKSR